VFSSQILGTNLLPRDQNKPGAVLVAEYFHQLDSWLDAYFDGLKSLRNWQFFYVHLVRILVNEANEGRADEGKIDVNQILVPRVTDIFQACRLMYQAIGRLRTAVPDGQHRMAALVEFLSGWKITVEARNIPPRAFLKGDHCGIAPDCQNSFVDASKEMETMEKFEGILKTLAGKVVVRVMLPQSIENLEVRSEQYSAIRERSQAKRKPRVLVDV
jgi:hypothetical protein